MPECSRTAKNITCFFTALTLRWLHLAYKTATMLLSAIRVVLTFQYCNLPLQHVLPLCSESQLSLHTSLSPCGVSEEHSIDIKYLCFLMVTVKRRQQGGRCVFAPCWKKWQASSKAVYCKFRQKDNCKRVWSWSKQHIKQSQTAQVQVNFTADHSTLTGFRRSKQRRMRGEKCFVIL